MMANCPKQLSNYTDRLALRNFLPPPPPLPHPILSALCSWDLDCVWWRQTGINQLKFLLCNSRPAEIQTQFGLDRDGATERQRDSLLLWKIADLHLWMQKDSGRKQVLMCLERSGGRCGFLVLLDSGILISTTSEWCSSLDVRGTRKTIVVN